MSKTTPITQDNLWQDGYTLDESPDGNDIFYKFMKIHSHKDDVEKDELLIHLEYFPDYCDEPVISITKYWYSRESDEDGLEKEEKRNFSILSLYRVTTMEKLRMIEGFISEP